jgi:hypothetical protein
MSEYISREAVLKAFKLKVKNPKKDYQRGMQDAIDCLIPEVIANIPTADVPIVISGDNCIVCGRDVRKDNVYYDVNGGTICESCMNTKCKCKNEGAKNE